MRTKNLKIKYYNFTTEGHAKLVAEQEELQVLRKATIGDLQKAREMGDLSENGFYKATKSRLGQLEHRIEEVEHLLRYAVVNDGSNKHIVQIGSIVTLVQNDKEQTYTIVGDFEANPIDGKISSHSPIGKGLMGRKVGETITILLPGRELICVIKTIA